MTNFMQFPPSVTSHSTDNTRYYRHFSDFIETVLDHSFMDCAFSIQAIAIASPISPIFSPVLPSFAQVHNPTLVKFCEVRPVLRFIYLQVAVLQVTFLAQLVEKLSFPTLWICSFVKNQLTMPAMQMSCKTVVQCISAWVYLTVLTKKTH